MRRCWLALSVALVSLARPVGAAPPSREECVEAHSRGQDQREKNKLVEARDAFLLCAQSSCPSLVQADCAQFGAEVAKLVPSVSFAARDGQGRDLAQTSVFVDEVQVTTRLDDGKAHELNPGRHALRFVHKGKEVRQDVVIALGEKGRSLVATFVLDAPAASAEPTQPPPPASAPPPPTATAPVAPPPAAGRSAVPLVFVGVGGAALIGGVVLTLIGRSSIPSSCTLSSHECQAPPGDKTFDDAKKAVSTLNVGLVVGGVGAAVLTGGLAWYFLQPTERQPTAAWAPWSDGRGGGMLYLRTF